MRAELQAAGTQLLEALALNDRQRRVLFDPTPAVDSLAEELIALRAHGVPEQVVRSLVSRVGELLTLNGQEGACEHDVTGRLDRLCRPGASSVLTIKSLARALRDDLATIARGDVGLASEFTAAALRIQDIVRTADPLRLRSRSLRHELGGARHDLLLTFLNAAERTRS